MRCEWKRVKLKDCCYFKEGYVNPPQTHPEYFDGDIKWIRAVDLNDSYVHTTSRTLSQIGFESAKKSAYLFPPDSIVISKSGTIGRLGIIKDYMCGNRATINIRPKENINLFYLFYFLRSKQREFANLAVGSVQKNLYISILEEIEIDLPSLQDQKRIAVTLSSLDNKIELNNKINENLERQARAFLSQWLIENDGTYEFTTLSEVAVINPDTYSPKDAWEYVNYLDTSSITDGLISEVQYIKPSTEKLPSRARRIIAANDVVFSTVRPNQRHFGIISKPLDHMLASTGFAVIRSNHPSVCNELLYLCLTKEDFIEKMQQLAEQSTSTFPSIKPTDLGSCKIPCPISKELTKGLKSVFTCIATNQKENQTLAELRDTILPKLMYGEIAIDEI